MQKTTLSLLVLTLILVGGCVTESPAGEAIKTVQKTPQSVEEKPLIREITEAEKIGYDNLGAQNSYLVGETREKIFPLLSSRLQNRVNFVQERDAISNSLSYTQDPNSLHYSATHSEQKEKAYIIQLSEKPILEIRKANKHLIVNRESSSELLSKLSAQKEKIELEQTEFLSQVSEMLGKNIQSTIAGYSRQLTDSKGELHLIASYKNTLNGLVLEGLSREDLKKLQKSPQIKRIEEDREVHAILDESIPLIGADIVHGLGFQGEGITIGIIDTGVDYSHPDLGGCFGSGCRVAGGYDFVNYDNDPMDDHGHGTHVAGITAANGVVKGVAPNATIYAYKVLSSNGSGTFSNVINAIERAVDPNQDGNFSDRLDVINLSLGGSGNPDDSQSQAIDNAVANGVVAVVAGGNDGAYGYETISSPGTARKAITVGASYKKDYDYTVFFRNCSDENPRRDDITCFSSKGPVIFGGEIITKPELVSPGAFICSSQWDDAWSSYECIDNEHTAISGTSMAAPHVAGLAALGIQAHPELSAEQIKSLVTGTVNPLGYNFFKNGNGRINATNVVSSEIVTDVSKIDFGIVKNNYAEQSVLVKNIGSQALSMTISVEAYRVMDPAMTELNPAEAVDYAQLNTSTISLNPGEEGSVALQITIPTDTQEGFYTGRIIFNYGGKVYRVPFSFNLLTTVEVHVLDEQGEEQFEWDGGVVLYSVPDAEVKQIKWAFFEPSPPASFIVPSGNYNVHAFGRMLMIWFGFDEQYEVPYFLSDTISVPQNSHVEVYLDLREAREFTLHTQGLSVKPIFITRWGIFGKYDSPEPFSFSYNISLLGLEGSALFNRPTSYILKMNNNDIDTKFLIRGFSYPPRFWRFLELNHDHMYQGNIDFDPTFSVDGTAAEQYLISYPIGQVNNQTPSDISFPEEYSTYDVFYDVAGSQMPEAGYQGFAYGEYVDFHLPTDPVAAIYPLYTGLRRKIFSNSGWAQKYASGSWNDVLTFSLEMYDSDWEHTTEIDGYPNVLIPQGEFVIPRLNDNRQLSMGRGPFYPGLYFDNSSEQIKMFYPLIRDNGGTVAGGVGFNSVPNFYLTKDGEYFSSDGYSEWWWLPQPMRYWTTTGNGFYELEISQVTDAEVSNIYTIKTGMNIGAVDMNPPVIKSVDMPQSFLLGDSLDIVMKVEDQSAIASVEMSYRIVGSGAWIDLSVEDLGGNRYATQIPSISDMSVYLYFKVTDEHGNYIEYTTIPAAVEKTPVNLEINLDTQRIPITDEIFSIHITGRLERENEEPLFAEAAIPIEMYVNNEFIGFVTDLTKVEDNYQTGDIDFEWNFIPTEFVSSETDPFVVRFEFEIGTFIPTTAEYSLEVVENQVLLDQVEELSTVHTGDSLVGFTIKNLGNTGDTYQLQVDSSSLPTDWSVEPENPVITLGANEEQISNLLMHITQTENGIYEFNLQATSLSNPANNIQTTIKVLYSNFKEKQVITQLSDWAYGLTSGDYSNQGGDDLLVSHWEGGLDYFINDSGTFSYYSYIDSWESLGIGLSSNDFDDDGDIDFIRGGYSDTLGILNLFSNNGDNSFSWEPIFSLGRFLWGVDSGDFDGDGDIDIVAEQYEGGDGTFEGADNVVILFNEGNNNFEKYDIPNSEFPWGAYRITAGDFDNDGDEDFVGVDSFVQINLFVNPGDGRNFEKILITDEPPEIDYIVGLDSADYDLDGKLDFVLGDKFGKVQLFKNLGNNQFNKVTIITGYEQRIGGLTSPDYDNDEDNDLVIGLEDGRVILYENIFGDSEVVTSYLFIENNSGQQVATFSDRGDIVLKGTCKVKSTCSPPQDSFVIKNSVEEVVAFVDSQGNLCIENGDCSGQDNQAPPSFSVPLAEGNNLSDIPGNNDFYGQAMTIRLDAIVVGGPQQYNAQFTLLDQANNEVDITTVSAGANLKNTFIGPSEQANQIQPNAWVDNIYVSQTTGIGYADLTIEYEPTCETPNPAFTINNDAGVPVITINENGELCLTGTLTQRTTPKDGIPISKIPKAPIQ